MHEAMKCAANESRINPQVNPRMVAPNQSDPDVIVIPAGEPVPTWIQPNKTLVFGPGEHRLQPSLVPKGKWPVYTLPSQVYVYIPVDAILYFAMVGRADETISIGGYGHLSGEEMPRCHFPYDDQRSRTSTDPANTTCTWRCTCERLCCAQRVSHWDNAVYFGSFICGTSICTLTTLQLQNL
eukprot:m.846372 g.846372  ORF g.846372 m.846372 type:complete len:182 (-) comp23477_c1_seq96:3921-4466(-)